MFLYKNIFNICENYWNLKQKTYNYRIKKSPHLRELFNSFINFISFLFFKLIIIKYSIKTSEIQTILRFFIFHYSQFSFYQSTSSSKSSSSSLTVVSCLIEIYGA